MVANAGSEWSRLLSSTFTCPSCNALQTIEPLQERGLAVISLLTSDTTVTSIDVKYPVFLSRSGVTPGYMLNVCKACRIRIVIELTGGRQTVVWPIRGASVSDDVAAPVRVAAIDAKLSHAVGSKTGAIMSLRTAVERLQRDKEVASLTELWERERLPPTFFDAANEPRHWGNVIAHEDFDHANLTGEHVEQLLVFFDLILDMVYETPAKLQRLVVERSRLDGDGEESGGETE